MEDAFGLRKRWIFVLCLFMVSGFTFFYSFRLFVVLRCSAHSIMFGFSDFSVFNGLVLVLLGFVGFFFGNFVINNFLLWSIASGSLKI